VARPYTSVSSIAIGSIGLKELWLMAGLSLPTCSHASSLRPPARETFTTQPNVLTPEPFAKYGEVCGEHAEELREVIVGTSTRGLHSDNDGATSVAAYLRAAEEVEAGRHLDGL
jgi:hypothetical protein